MVGSSIQGDRVDSIAAQYFHHVSRFQVVLAQSSTGEWIYRKPPWRRVVHEWVVEQFRHFMAKRGDVLEAAAEKTVRDPAGVVHDKAPFTIAVLGVARFKI